MFHHLTNVIHLILIRRRISRHAAAQEINLASREHPLITFEDTRKSIKVALLNSAFKCIQRFVGKHFTAVFGSLLQSIFAGSTWIANITQDVVRCHSPKDIVERIALGSADVLLGDLDGEAPEKYEGWYATCMSVPKIMVTRLELQHFEIK